MGGRKAQVSLFVLIGFVILLGIIILIVAVNKKEAAVGTDLEVDTEIEGNPELAAEKARMTKRFEDCIENVAQELLSYPPGDITATTSAELEMAFASELQAVIPDCLNQFNLEELPPLGEPAVDVSISDTGIDIIVEYPLSGEFEDETYTLSNFQTVIPSHFKRSWEKSKEIEQELAERMNNPDIDESFLSPDGYMDLYAFEDEGIYLDLLVKNDLCLPIIHDYSAVREGEQPFVFKGKGFECNFSESQTVELPTVLPLIDDYQCSLSAECSPLPFTANPWPEDATINSPIPINHFSFAPITEGYPPGVYTAVFEGTGEDGKKIIQTAVFEVTP